LILKDSAGEYDGIEAENLDGIAEALGYAALKGSGALGDVSSAEAVSDEGGQERTEVEIRKRIWLDVARAAGNVLDPHGCLAFEGYFARETQQGRGGVEETPDGGGLKRPGIFADQFKRLLEAGGKEKGLGAQVRQIFQLVKESGGGLDGIAGGGVATGEGGLTEMGHTREAFGDAADE
jgi:hypothetical protein